MSVTGALNYLLKLPGFGNADRAMKEALPKWDAIFAYRSGGNGSDTRRLEVRASDRAAAWAEALRHADGEEISITIRTRADK